MSAKILVVDDEESVAVTMGAILELEGYDVETVTHGTAALDRIRQGGLDLVLTDLRLDDLDGLTIVSAVAERDEETQSIILTGYASLESAVKALRQGAYDYLVKPCDVDELRVTVARAIERRQLGQQLRARVQDLEVANATIRSLNEDLQRRVDEATAELQQRMRELAEANREIAQLYQASQEHVEQLEMVGRLKTQFLSMASHELKTPLTAISGLSQIMLRRMQRYVEQGAGNSDDLQTELAATLERLQILTSQTARLGRLVDELLDVSRIEAGKVEFRFAPLDVGRLVHDVAERMQLTSTMHDVLVADHLLDMRTITADQDHLEQVLNNLLSNAIKYSPEGGPVGVDVRPDLAGNGVEISVSDAGMGIPPSELASVFDLFYQARDPLRRTSSGMGLGLYISKEIVERHGGRIWAESEPGRGSTFHVWLPSIARPAQISSQYPATAA